MFVHISKIIRKYRKAKGFDRMQAEIDTDKADRMECQHDPRTMLGKPIGMYHCPECGEMVIAGMRHPTRAEALEDNRRTEDTMLCDDCSRPHSECICI